MIRIPSFFGVLLLFLLGPGQAAAESPFAVYKSESSHEDVMEALKMAIQNRGMYINNVMHMSEMLERTGKDLGIDQKIYANAESVEFCSAVLSRKMTSEDPARIVNCPFIISVYTLPDEPDTTYIVHRKVWIGDSEGAMQEVAEMLQALGKAAAEGF
jgi:uncharacterized protein (DUF302 family)